MSSLRRFLRHLFGLLLLVPFTGGCSQGADAGDAHDPMDAAQAVVDAAQPSTALPEWEKLQAVCRPRDEAIRHWMDGFRRCDVDADCAVTQIEAKCAPAFLCPTVLSVRIDRPAFEREAASIEAEYRPVCGCPIADCTAARELSPYCDPTTKLCAHRNACVAVDGGQVLCSGQSGGTDAALLSR